MVGWLGGEVERWVGGWLTTDSHRRRVEICGLRGRGGEGPSWTVEWVGGWVGG